MKNGFIFASRVVSYVGAVAFLAWKRQGESITSEQRSDQIAHVLRRCGFGPRPGEVERWLDDGAEALIESLLANDAAHALAPENVFDGFSDSSDVDDVEMFTTFVDQMMNGANQLHERMTWYWHTHFTTSVEAAGRRLAWQQHHLIRRLALGNFRELARQITTDAAMLHYLDGGGSRGDEPNENYSREFLELFALGRNGGYTEDDVRAAARIVSGWHADWETGEVSFEPDHNYSRPVTFMGKRQRWSVDSFVDFVCARPECHRHVVTRLYNHLVGPDLDDGRRDELATVFAEADLEIRPLVAAILRGEDFLGAIHSRTRQPIEWALGAIQALGFTSVDQLEIRPWQFRELGQMPMQPPNVGGWSLDDRWASTSHIITRTSHLLNWELPESTISQVAPTVDDVLARCGIYDPSPSTRAALDRIENDFSEFDFRLELLFVTALTSPEFTLL